MWSKRLSVIKQNNYGDFKIMVEFRSNSNYLKNNEKQQITNRLYRVERFRFIKYKMMHTCKNHFSKRNANPKYSIIKFFTETLNQIHCRTVKTVILYGNLK